jgi:hypothetical protein
MLTFGLPFWVIFETHCRKKPKIPGRLVPNDNVIKMYDVLPKCEETNMDFYGFVQICPLIGISLSFHAVFYTAFVVDLLWICRDLHWICYGIAMELYESSS